jgi:UDP-N-acetylmuramate--alanine ligase
VALLRGADPQHVRRAMANFQGVSRRMTPCGHYHTAGGHRTLIIDDYAHHPTEIKAVLSAIRARGYQRILAICQPHRYSRLQDAMAEFSTAFVHADHVALLPVYSAGEAPIAGISSLELYRQLLARGQSAELCAQWPLSRETLHSLLEHQSFDVAVCLGAGDITHMAYALAHVPASLDFQPAVNV